MKSAIPSPALGLVLGAIGVTIFGLTLPMTRIALDGFSPLFITFGRAVIASAAAGTALLVLGGETVGINDSRATFALPDIAAKRKRLAERQPRLSGETMLDDSPPEDENIDAGIGPAG